MNRKDSGYVASSRSRSPRKKESSEHKNNATSTSQRGTKKAAATSVSSSQPKDMNSERAASEKRSRPSRQQSSTSSFENAASRSKGRGHGSRHSSHRTSCTIVDPSRPARHYRMRSAHTVPTQDVDDVLALHFRGCSLFTNPSYHSGPGLPSPTLSQEEPFTSQGVPSRSSSDEITVAEISVTPKESEETLALAEQMNAPMQWTSPSTRRRDYERIDKANSGLRGFFRKVTPRCVSGQQEKFYEKDNSDTGSVRRYRLDDGDDFMDEKDVLRPHTSAYENSTTQSKTKKKWVCF